MVWDGCPKPDVQDNYYFKNPYVIKITSNIKNLERRTAILALHNSLHLQW